jgi:hypothetical protein
VVNSLRVGGSMRIVGRRARRAPTFVSEGEQRFRREL